MEKSMQCQTLSMLHILGKKWSIPIIETISSGKGAQFNTLQAILEEITPKNLSSGLKDLVDAEIIKKNEKRYNNVNHTEYVLTEKGRAVSKFIKSAKQLGVCIYGIDPSCPNRKCADCIRLSS